jgi:glycosyltransferase involved in cell wall biosynthesis
MRTKTAIVCALMPEFDRDAGSCRVADLIDFLREGGWAVTFVSHHANCERRYAEVLQQRGIAVYAGASAHMPALIESGQFDLALFGLWHVAEPFIDVIRRTAPQMRIVVDSVDLHFLRHARRRFTEQRTADGPTVLDGAYGAELVREINTYNAADAVLTVSQKEADLVNDFLGRRSVAFPVPQCESLDMSSVPLKDRKGILFIGCFRHTPNADAVEYLCRDILPHVDPKILARHPVQIVGDGLSEDVRRHGAGTPQVHMIGWVPSVVPYLEHARLTVLPLRYGAGTKRKLLQTLAVGTPAVSTSIGAEGFGLIDGTHALIADDAVAFADSITKLAHDDRLWRRLSRRGRADIATRHSRVIARRLLLEVVDTVLAFPPQVARSAVNSIQDSITQYAELVVRMRETVTRCVPAGATVAVVSKGDQELLKLDGMTGWHFPQSPTGEYAGWYPPDSDAAIQQVRALVDRGARYLVFPATALWWLEHYAGLQGYLDSAGRKVVSEPGACVIYALNAIERVASAVNRPSDAPLSNRAEGQAQMGDRPAEREPVTIGHDALRVIAFLLPQFHPIPENDAWWGKGFTEWTNVSRAKPLFPGHDQPRVPADLGFYDLRLAETREMQAELARAHGIHGFCYYHYWFDGKRLLERPFNEVLTSGRPDFPFCLCWANEPWSRRWDGQPRDVLQPQTYSLDDDRRHIKWLIPALRDPRAINIDGKPIFLVYQVKELPDPARTADIWRTEVERAGLRGIYLIAIETGWDAGWDATAVGFDAKVLFQPQFSMLRTVPRSNVTVAGHLEVYDYDAAWPILANPEPVRYRRYSSVFPCWDNSPRRGVTGVAVHNATPASYEAWLRHTIEHTRRDAPEHQIVFINAWNEWGEGCYLEPDVKNGRAFLEATARAVRAPRAVDAGTHVTRTMMQMVTRAKPIVVRSARRNGSSAAGQRSTVLHQIPGRRLASGDRGVGK